MLHSYSFAWILVSLLLLALAAPLQAGIIPSGNVDPKSTSWWTGGGNSSKNAYIGYNAAGNVTVDLDSDLSSYKGYIGHGSSSVGEVTVDGSDSAWTSSGVILVGRRGQGTLNITNGGVVSDYRGRIGYYSGSDGVATVDGSGSTWTSSDEFCVGRFGHGTLNITNGGGVSNTLGYIGDEAVATGEVTVDGSGSAWTNSGYLYVGESGQGMLNITNGGTVSDYRGYIGYGSGSAGVVTVDGSGSTWISSNWVSGGNPVAIYNVGNLLVGGSGQGMLNITNGGTVSDYRSYIGYGSGSTGEVTVDGSDSTWNNRDKLYIGCFGHGTLNITGGGLVRVFGTLFIDDYGDGDGFVNMATGGMLAIRGQADDSLADFMGLIDGTDAICYWDGSSWADITGATYDQDYTLAYLTEGTLAGYTMLTVPEPTAMLLLAFGGLTMLRRQFDVARHRK